MSNESEQVLREILGQRFDELNETTRTILLGTPAETIRKAHAKLLELGLTPEKIASQPQLLGMNPDTIQRNYEFLRGFLSKETILDNPQLLGSSRITVQSSVQYLKEFGINPDEYPFMCGTTVRCKRRKAATLLRVRFNYPAVLQEDEKRELRDKAREFIKLKPQILGMSEKAIEKRFAKAA